MDAEDEKIAAEADAIADAIAMKLSSFMIEGFKAKEGRDPTTEEISNLFEELTPERIAELLGEEGVEGQGAEEEGREDEGADADAGEGDVSSNDDEDSGGKAEEENKAENGEKAKVTGDPEQEQQKENNKRNLTNSDDVLQVDDKRVRVE